jgi:hypothetical protein
MYDGEPVCSSDGGRDMNENDDKVGSWSRIILLTFLVLLALTLILPGAVVYQSVIEDWANDPRGFYGIEGAVNWIFGVCGAGAIAAGLIIVGVILRLMRQTWITLASLALSIASVGFIILTYYVFSDANTTSNSIEIVFLQACCIALLFLVALPPFLHWALAKPATAPAPTEPQP